MTGEIVSKNTPPPTWSKLHPPPPKLEILSSTPKTPLPTPPPSPYLRGVKPWLPALLLLALALPARAGMTSFDLSDIARLRLEVISFFIVTYLLLALAVKALWNNLAKTFRALPRLGFRQALALMLVSGLLLYVVLTMISGARELMTPGAWTRKGVGYQLAENPEPKNPSPRRAALQSLRDRLWEAAAASSGKFPLQPFAPPLRPRDWKAPTGGFYSYFPPAQSPPPPESLVACEPPTAGGKPPRPSRRRLHPRMEQRPDSPPPLTPGGKMTTAAAAKRPLVRWKVVLPLGILLALLFLVVLGGMAWPFQAAWALLTGWFSYPLRALPLVEANPSMTVCGLAALALALWAGHRLLRSLAPRFPALPAPWPFRLTAVLFALLLLAFGTSIAMTGIVHQLAWLATSGEPNIVRNGSSVRIKATHNAKQLHLALFHYEDKFGRFPDRLEDLVTSGILEPAGWNHYLCPAPGNPDGDPWLYLGAGKSSADDPGSPLLVSPAPYGEDHVILRIDGAAKTLSSEELAPLLR